MKYLPSQYKTDAYIKAPDLFCFVDQKIHLIDPLVKILPTEIGLGKLAKHFYVIKGLMGSGKTHSYGTNLVYKIFEEAESQGIKDGVIVITAPGLEVVESIKELFRDFYNKYYKDDIRGKKINELILPIKSGLDDVINLGFGVVVCTIQHFQSYSERLNGFPPPWTCLAVIHDEAHKGLGCPDTERYYADLGRTSKSTYAHPYEAKWFQAAYKFPAMIKVMFTGTLTDSMLTEYNGIYKILSNDMESPRWRLPILRKPKFYSDYQSILNASLEDVVKLNVIAKHFKKLPKKMYKELFPKGEPKFTNLSKCCSEIGKGMKIIEAQKWIDQWNDEHRDMQFQYKSLITGKEETLYYKDGLGDYITMIDKTKAENDYEEDEEAFSELRDSNSKKQHLLVVEKGAMGINVPSFCSIAYLRNSTKDNPEVTNNEEQFCGRLARGVFVWPEFIKRIFTNYSEQEAELLLRLAIEISTVSVHAFDNIVQKTAVERFEPSLIPEDSAYDVLMMIKTDMGLNDIITASGKDRDGLYRKFKKDRCERPNCSCYNDFVTNPPKGSFEAGLTLEERKANYEGMLEVHHKDSNRFNNNPENFETDCSNAHRSLTMQNKDYLTEYDTELV